MKNNFQIIFKGFAGFLSLAVVSIAHAQQPTISSLSTLSGYPASTIIINGANFNSSAVNNIVYFGATKATVSAASTTSLSVNVPTGATYMSVSVDNIGSNLIAYSQNLFIPSYNNSGYASGLFHFDAKVDFTTSGSPYIIALGDIDGDGKTDIVVSNLASNNVSIYRNTSSSGAITSGSFASRIDIAAGYYAFGVSLADFDGDGKLDMAVVNQYDNTIYVYRNTSTPGSISFASSVSCGTGNGPQILAIGDIDGDGRLDMAVNDNASSLISLYRNTSTPGSISFAAKVDFVTATGPAGIAMGDIDGDGKSDIIVSCDVPNVVSVFRNTATSGTINSGSLATRVDFTAIGNPYHLVIGDIDGDGKLDITTGNNAASISVFPNTSTTGAVSFGTRVDFTSGSNARVIELGDMDGDGKPDITVADNGANTVSVFRNTSTIGSIGLAPKVDFATGSSPYGVAIGDLDGDGKPEIVASNSGVTSISILRNDPLLSASFCIPTSGLVAWYPFTGNANDSSGNSINGTISGASLTTDRFGHANSAYSFNGSTDYIEIPYSSSFDNANYSFSFWTKTALSTFTSGGPDVNQGVLSRVQTGGSGLTTGSSNPWVVYEIGGAYAYNSAGIAGGAASGGAGVQTLYDMSDNTWRHVVYTVSNDSAICYENGVRIGANHYTVPITYSPYVTRIGRSLNTYWKAFQGSVDDIAIYNRVLTPAEVMALYNSNPVVLPITGLSTVCSGANITLSDATSGGTWSSSNSSVATINSSGGVTGVSNGVDTISYSITGSCGSTSATTIITIGIPSVTFTATPNPVCLGSAVTFNSGAPLCSGDALNFNGTTSSAPHGSVLTTATNNITMEAWVNWNGAGFDQFIELNGNSSSTGYAIFQTAGNVHVLVSGVTEMTSSYTLTPNVWTHIAAVCDAAHNWTLYVNGTAVTLSGGTATPATPTAGYYVGTNNGGGQIWNGLLDEVKLWNVARTATQIQADMIACNTLPQSGLLAYYKFDEGSGTIASDASGNGNNLTLSNISWVTSTEPLSTYMWSYGDGGTSTANNITHTYSATGTYTSSLTVTNSSGCTGTATIPVVVGGVPIITTVTGNNTAGFAGDGALATSAQINSAWEVATDIAGNIYIADNSNQRIRKINTAGIISTIAGTGSAGFSSDGVAATASQLNQPTGVAVDNIGNIYIADNYNNRIRKINLSGIISTIAGTGASGFSGDGGQASSATLSPNNLVLDNSGNIYFSDGANHRIRKINSAGIITTIAGTGTAGYSGDGGAATSAQIDPEEVVLDNAGNLYISEYNNHRIRKVNLGTGMISTFAGTGSTTFNGDGILATAANIYHPRGFYIDASGIAYISESGDNRIRKVSLTGIISTIAGTGAAGYSGDFGPATAGLVSSPYNLAGDLSGNLYFTDGLGNLVRKISSGNTTVLAITGSSSTCLGAPTTLSDATTGGTWSSSNTAIATISSSGVVTGVSAGAATISYSVSGGCGSAVAVYGITVGSGTPIISTIAGNGTTAFSGDGGAATAAGIVHPYGVTVDKNGAIYVCEPGDQVIRKVSSAGVIATIAGTGSSGFSGDGGAATSALLQNPIYNCVDTLGNLYFSDLLNQRIRKINSSGIITTIAGNGATGFSGDGSQATTASFFNPHGVCIDAVGNLYVSDYSNNRIRKINTLGIISTICGTGTAGFSGDGGAATLAKINQPDKLVIDHYGNLYFTDLYNNRVRKITPSGIISTIGGDGTTSFYGDGGSATAAAIDFPTGLSVDNNGNIYVVESDNRVRKIDTGGIIQTFAGTGTAGYSGDGGSPTSAMISGSIDLACDIYGNLFISDNGNNRIRKITSGTGTVAPITGTSSVCTGSNITLSDATSGGTWSSSNTSIATINSSGVVTGVGTGTETISYSVAGTCGSAVAVLPINVNGGTPIITTIAGTGTGGYIGDGVATATEFNGPNSLHVDAAGNVFVADLNNNRVRKINLSGIITTVAGTGTGTYTGDGGAATAATFFGITDVTVDATGNLYIADGYNNVIRKVNSGTGVVTTIAGNGYLAGTFSGAFSGDGGPSTNAEFHYPNSVALDGSGNIFIADQYNHRIRKVNAGTGIITTVAGNGTGTYAGDGGQATASSLNLPSSIVFDAAGNLIIVDHSNTRIRKVDMGTGIISTIAGNGTPGFTGDGGQATAAELNYPETVTVGADGNVYITDNNRIRVISTSGIISTYAGNGTAGFSGDGGPATAAAMQPGGLCFDAFGNLYDAEYSNNRIRKISVGLVVMGITGSSTICIGTPTSLADATTGGTWSSSNTSLATVSTGGIVTGVSSGVDTISYTVIGLCSTNAVIKPITINPLPSVNSITGTAAVCAGGAITSLYETTTGGTWSSSNTSIATINSSGVVSGVAAGIDTISYTVIGVCGSSTATLIVTVNPLPNAGSITGTAAVCAGGATTTLSDATTGGTWSSVTTSTATISGTGVVTGVATGTSLISYTVANSCGTTAATVIVTVNPLPNAGTITGTAIVCEGGAITTLSDATSGGTWSSVTTSAATINSSGVVAGVATGTSLVSYTYSNSCGTAATTVVVTVNPLPYAGSITGTAVVCAGGATTTLNDATSGGTWSSVTTSAATISGTGVVTGVATGTSLISYTVANSCGTTAATVIVTVNPLPNAGTITGTAIVCEGGATTTLSDATSGGTWSSVTTSAATINSSGVVTGVATGTSLVSYTYSNSCGTAATTVVVTVNPLPNAGTITGPSSVCVAAAITLADGVSGGVWSSRNLAIASVSTGGIVTGVLAGIDTITYSVTTVCGVATTSKTITVNPLPLAGSIIGAPTVCMGSTITLTDTTAGGIWNSSNSLIIGVSGGVISGVTTGTAIISYSITNICGTAIITHLVTVNSVPVIGAITGPNNICITGSSTYTDTTNSGTQTWSVSPVLATVSSGVVIPFASGLTTLTYSATNTCGTTSATMAITISPVPVPGMINGIMSVCQGGVDTLTETVSGGLWSSSDNLIATVTGGVVSGLVAGSVIISYSVNNICGTVVAYRGFAVNSIITPPSITGTTSLCMGATTTLLDLLSGGEWSSSDTTVARVSAGVVSGIAAGTSTIRYSITDMCGTGTVSATITVNAIPDAGNIIGYDSVCEGSSIMFSASVTGGTWSTTNTNAAVVTGNVIGMTAGIDSIVYTVTNGCGANLSYKVVTVNPKPANILGMSIICMDSTILLTDLTTGGTWSSTVSSVASVSSPGVVTAISSGTTYISYTLPSGCAAARAINVGVNPPAITGIDSVCPSGTVTLYDALSGATWNSGTSTIATIDSSGVVTGHISGTAVISYNYFGCVVTEVVTVLPNPNAGVVFGADSLCIGNSINLGDTSANTIGSWSSANSKANVVLGIVTGLAAGPDTIYYSVHNSCGTTVAAHTVYIRQLPNAGLIIGTDSVCVGSNITLTDTTSGGIWGITNANAINTEGIVTGISEGIDTLVYTNFNSCGQIARTSKKIFIISPPLSGVISGAATVCAGSTVTLTESITGGLWTVINPHASVITGGIVSGISAGLDTIKYSVTNMCGISNASHAIMVMPLPFAGSITGLNNICAGTVTTLTDGTTGGTWSSVNTSIATVTSGGIVAGLVAGTTTIDYEVINSCGTDSALLVMTINPKPNAGFISGGDSLCIGSTLTLTDGNTGGTWSSRINTVATVASGIVYGVGIGTDTIFYSVSNICGTKDTFHILVVASPLTPSIMGSNYACYGIGGDTLYGSPIGGTWSSSNPSLATVSTAGIVVANDTTGYVIISYTMGNICGINIATETVTLHDAAHCNNSVPELNGNDNSINLYPNPTDGLFTVQLPHSGSNVKVEITDVFGKVILTTFLENNQELKLNYELSNVARGTYLVKVLLDEKVFREKLVIW